MARPRSKTIWFPFCDYLGRAPLAQDSFDRDEPFPLRGEPEVFFPYAAPPPALSTVLRYMYEHARNILLTPSFCGQAAAFGFPLLVPFAFSSPPFLVKWLRTFLSWPSESRTSSVITCKQQEYGRTSWALRRSLGRCGIKMRQKSLEWIATQAQDYLKDSQWRRADLADGIGANFSAIVR